MDSETIEMTKGITMAERVIKIETKLDDHMVNDAANQEKIIKTIEKIDDKLDNFELRYATKDELKDVKESVASNGSKIWYIIERVAYIGAIVAIYFLK